MALKVSQQLTIRQRYMAGEAISSIAEDLKVDRKTVRKYAREDDFNVKPPRPRQRSFPSLEGYTDFVDGLLEADRRSWRKQRLTAKRVWTLVVEEGCQVSVTTVERYVRQWREDHAAVREAMLELEWEAGEAQVDFGEADFLEAGRQVRRHFLVVSFPYSNMAYTQLFGGETAECVTQGLIDIFNHIGGAPTRIVFDNATGIGRRRGEVVKETELFSRLRTHYGFEATFCNPESGNEKGNVENKVGFIRRNLFTPIVEIASMEAVNQDLFGACERLQGDREHYRKGRTTTELFQADKQALRELPRTVFKALSYRPMRTDRYGGVSLGKHHYSGDPNRSLADVLLEVGAHHLRILDEATHEVIASHRRQYGEETTSSVDVISQLKVLAFKSRGWRNSNVRGQLPVNLVEALDQMEITPRRHALAQLADSIEMSGVDATFQAVSEVQAVSEARAPSRDMDFTAVGALAARIRGYGLDPTPLPGPDLTVYDTLKGVA